MIQIKKQSPGLNKQGTNLNQADRRQQKKFEKAIGSQKFTLNVSYSEKYLQYLHQNMASSFGNCTTGTGNYHKAQKIQISFEDHIKSSKNFRISLFPWIRIDELKKLLAREKFQNHVAWSDIRLFYKNIELTPDSKRCLDLGVDQDSKIVIKNVEAGLELDGGIINPYQIFDEVPEKITNLILEVQSGLNSGKNPKLTEEGTSGTYFLENHMNKVVGIFKPFDEEPYADENPRNYIGTTGSPGIRKGILSGESATREVAAYLIDQQKFHGVPETTYIEFFHPSFIKKSGNSQPIASDPEKVLKQENKLKTKHGSLQSFMDHNDIAGNMGSNQFDVEEVHKIGILDLRILNCDRNQANILVKKLINKENKKKILKLIPIDHGLSFPDSLEIYDEEIVWMGYRQASQPFSEKSLKLIKSIDPIKDCQQLKKKLGFREICLRNFRIAQTFLKRTAGEGYTLFQIGEMMYRKEQDDSEEQSEKIKKEKNLSDLEKIVQYAENTYLLVKQNGIKSTINFQLNCAKPKNKYQESMPELQSTKQESFKALNQVQQGLRQTSRETSLEKKTDKTNKKAENGKQKCSPSKIRNVSLPNMKLDRKDSKYGGKQRSKKRENRQKHKIASKNLEQQWDEVFFHYFEQFLERFLQQKRKKKSLGGSRNRLLSQDMNYGF